MRPQTRVRKMRKPGRRPADGTTETYFDPDIRAARRARDRRARDRETGLAGRRTRTAGGSSHD